ncbi:energy transducer TonB [Rhabdobacter roseus]|uniref:Protein TonB n=1 Tax=Rhabdobacter roseus TaxID=1655419 RepID=A0A840TSR8_9BACT|nr:TonB family protein [Rhabdobacter roseus]MBB5287426.1 protein TonB [Rhabdobacter roseus]
MKRLPEIRLADLSRYLESCGLVSALYPELLDHLACEVEERLWAGLSFEEALRTAISEADPETLRLLGIEHKHLLAMEQSLDDIVFEGRNQQYGAYVLRREYKRTVQRATLLGVTLFLLIFLLPNLYARLVPDPDEREFGFEVTFEDVVLIKPTVTPPPATPAPPPPAVKTVRSLPPVVLPDNQVPVDSPPPTLDELEGAQPGEATVDGLANVDIVVPPAERVVRSSETVLEVKPEAEKVHLYVEQQPTYRGGSEAMAAFLRKHLRYPHQAARVGVQGKVYVEFTVGADGTIEKARAVKGIGFGCDEEALRVVQMMPNWVPGKQAGQPVRVRFTLPIAFQLE